METGVFAERRRVRVALTLTGLTPPVINPNPNPNPNPNRANRRVRVTLPLTGLTPPVNHVEGIRPPYSPILLFQGVECQPG